MLGAMPSRDDSSRISPTAFYTGHVWCRNGLSDPGLSTRAGALLFGAIEPSLRLYRALTGSVTLEQMLLRRHRLIDHLLERSIEAGRVGQVLEIAGGLSGRGVRFSRRYAERGLVYVEGDLGPMAKRKREMLDRAGLHRENHRVVALDALAEAGPLSLNESVEGLFDSAKGTAVITEGLFGYLPNDQMAKIARNVREFLRRYPHGQYLADTHLRDHMARVSGGRMFPWLLGVFVRGRIYLHFSDAREAQEMYSASGFEKTLVHSPNDFAMEIGLPALHGLAPVHITEATVG